MVSLTKEQQGAVRGIIKDIKQNNKQILKLSGFAGTGKSTCLCVLSDILDGFGVCAYTGVAANTLRKKGLQASTIHSLIYKPNIQPSGDVEFILKDKIELGCEGFTCDESSMINKDVYDDLLSFGLPIIFIGDHGQLEPVGQDVNVMADPDYKLETIHRNAGEIAFFAEHLRKGRHARNFKAEEKVIFVEPSEVTDDMVLKTDQMICAYNKTRVGKNQQVRELKGYDKLLEKGELIMCLRNSRKLGLFNGMQGVVTKIHRKAAKLDFWSDGVTYKDIVYDPNQFGQEKPQFEFGLDSPNPFDYGYCVTCHKSQSKEWEDVMVFEQVCDKWDHKRWAYTAASRAKATLRWVTEKRFCPAWLF